MARSEGWTWQQQRQKSQVQTLWPHPARRQGSQCTTSCHRGRCTGGLKSRPDPRRVVLSWSRKRQTSPGAEAMGDEGAEEVGGDVAEDQPRPKRGRGSAKARRRAEVSRGQGRGEKTPERCRLRQSWKRGSRGRGELRPRQG
eukprot:1453082-Rhodomonas_salina.1